MRTGTIAMMGALAAAWAVSFSAAQTVEDDARALAARRRAAGESEAKRKAEARIKARARLVAMLAGPLKRLLSGPVPHAKAVGIGTVISAKEFDFPRRGPRTHPMGQAVVLRPANMLYGPRPKGEKVSLSVDESPRDRLVRNFTKGEKVSLRILRPRDPLVRRLKKGEKIIFAWGKTPGDSPGAVRWSKQAEKAVLFALAPGWERGKCFRCPRCRGKGWTEGKGKCGLCGGAAASGAFKLCAKCATPAGRCQMCKRTVGPATRGAKIHLTSRDPRAKAKVAPAGMAEASFELGERIRLWVSASVKGDVAVAELPCPGGEELGGCETLYFIVDAPGRREAAVLFPILPLRRAKAELHPTPLTNSTAKDRIFAARMVLDDKKKVFERPGRYTVRAAAGRLVSKPVTVVVKEQKPAVPPPQPLPPRPQPAWLENVVPQITPDGKGVQATMNGKMLWKVSLREAVGAVEQKDGRLVVTSKDGKTVVTLDLATGRMISKRVTR